MTPRARRLCLLTAVCLCASVAHAHAYTLESAASDGCHERLASDAIHAIRASLPGGAPVIEPTKDEKALIDDLPFELDEDLQELAAASLLLGVRDNDLKGRGAEELDALARVHGDPAGQREHCLRRPEHDEPAPGRRRAATVPGVSAAALRGCARGPRCERRSGPAVRDVLPVTLAVRGEVDAALPAFWVRMGQALHAVQDGFTHTYRTADGLRITAVVNWVDIVGKTYEERRDGPPHSGELDRCDDADELRTLRRTLAIEASREMLSAALDPAIAPDQRTAAARGRARALLHLRAGLHPR